ncbi:MAG: hypothetical protein ACR2PR_03310, partial [Pseudohongiellaceae bacterium]
LFGTDPHKLHTTDGPITSAEAAYAVDSAGWEERVYEAVKYFGANGCIHDDVWRYIIEKDYPDLKASDPQVMRLANTISGRFRALRDKGLIVYTGELRKAQSGHSAEVRVAKDFVPEWTATA